MAVEKVIVVDERTKRELPKWATEDTQKAIATALAGRTNDPRLIGEAIGQSATPMLDRKINEQFGERERRDDEARNHLLKQLGLGVSGFTKETTRFAGYMLDMEPKLSSLNPVIDDWTRKLEHSASKIAGIAAIFGATLTKATDYIDRSTSAYRRILAAGSEVEGGLLGLTSAAHHTSMTMDEFADYVYRSSRTVAAVGIQNVGRFHQEVYDSLRPIQFFGMQLQELRDHTANYMEMLRMTGRYEELRSGQAAASFQEFTNAALTIANMTGQTREDVMERAFKNLQDPVNSTAQLFLQLSDPAAAERIARIQGAFAGLPEQVSGGFANALSQVVLQESAAASDTGRVLSIYASSTAAAMEDLARGSIDVQDFMQTFQRDIARAGPEMVRSLGLLANQGNQEAAAMLEMMKSMQGVDFTGTWEDAAAKMAEQAGSVQGALSVESTIRSSQLAILRESVDALRPFVDRIDGANGAIAQFTKAINSFNLRQFLGVDEEENITDLFDFFGDLPGGQQLTQQFTDAIKEKIAKGEDVSEAIKKRLNLDERLEAPPGIGPAQEETANNMAAASRAFFDWTRERTPESIGEIQAKVTEMGEVSFDESQIAALVAAMGTAVAAPMAERFASGEQTMRDLDKAVGAMGPEFVRGLSEQQMSLLNGLGAIQVVEEKNKTAIDALREQVEQQTGRQLSKEELAQMLVNQLDAVSPTVVPVDYQLLSQSVSGAISPWMVTEQEKTDMLATKLDTISTTATQLNENVTGLREVVSNKTITLPSDFYSSLREIAPPTPPEAPAITATDWRDFMLVQRESIEAQRQALYLLNEVNVNILSLRQRFKDLGYSLAS